MTFYFHGIRIGMLLRFVSIEADSHANTKHINNNLT